MEAVQTANGKYHYLELYHDKSLHDWIQAMHLYNCQTNNWNYTPLKKGAFGYDNLGICLGNAFNATTHWDDMTELATNIHESWIENYVYWRDYAPWTRTDVKYYQPFNALGDERRDQCANTSFSNLPLDEQQKDLVLATFLKTHIRPNQH